MNERSDEISLLLSRLTHPSGMVREKTCTAFAGLLMDDHTRVCALECLQSCIDAGVLESVAILHLLIHIRAKMISKKYVVPEAGELVSKFKPQSVLSWMLARELSASEIEPPVWKGLCSKDLPADFRPDQFFQKYTPALVGEILVKEAGKVTKNTGYPFANQWAWESSLLVKSARLTIRERTFWQRGDSDSTWYASYYFRLTDILLSAFLRTLAWALEKKVITLGKAIKAAALCCPIDLALWKVESHSRPTWWPVLTIQNELIETSAGKVIASVNKVFDEFIPEQCDWVPIQASGFVGDNGSKIFLEIYALLQWCLGVKEPDTAKIVDWCRTMVSPTFFPSSPLATTGILMPKSLHLTGKQRQFDDWVVAPASEIIPFEFGMNWQWWRYYRKLWGPANFLTDSPFLMEPAREGVIFKNEGHEVARWFDWADLIRETVYANLPPYTGQCLIIKRELLAKFPTPVVPNLCWVWSISVFHRRHESGRYDVLSHTGHSGATRLFRSEPISCNDPGD